MALAHELSEEPTSACEQVSAHVDRDLDPGSMADKTYEHSFGTDGTVSWPCRLVAALGREPRARVRLAR